ncbi:MAG: IPT/TIG domain-containing protein [bacterium]
MNKSKLVNDTSAVLETERFLSAFFYWFFWGMTILLLPPNMFAQNPEQDSIRYLYDPVGNRIGIEGQTINPSGVHIRSFMPSFGIAGEHINIFGKGFNPGFADSNEVYFNDVRAEVVRASWTTIEVIIPEGAAPGPVHVANANGSGTSPEPFRVLGLKLEPASVTVHAPTTAQFTATPIGFTPDDLIWKIEGVPGGNGLVGTITSSGLYIPPPFQGTPLRRFLLELTNTTGPFVFRRFAQIEVAYPDDVGGILGAGIVTAPLVSYSNSPVFVRKYAQIILPAPLVGYRNSSDGPATALTEVLVVAENVSYSNVVDPVESIHLDRVILAPLVSYQNGMEGPQHEEQQAVVIAPILGYRNQATAEFEGVRIFITAPPVKYRAVPTSWNQMQK